MVLPYDFNCISPVHECLQDFPSELPVYGLETHLFRAQLNVGLKT